MGNNMLLGSVLLLVATASAYITDESTLNTSVHHATDENVKVIWTKKGSETFSWWTSICQDQHWTIICSDPRAKLNFSKLGPGLEKYTFQSHCCKRHICKISIKGRFSSAGFKTESPLGCAGGIMDFLKLHFLLRALQVRHGLTGCVWTPKTAKCCMQRQGE